MSNSTVSQTYIRAILEGDEGKVSELKQLLVPSKLYKYFPLSHEELSCLDEKRLDAIRNNNIWVSAANILDDPFETSTFIDWGSHPLDYESFNKINNVIDSFGSVHLILSLARPDSQNPKSGYNNMPLWAMYGNNHHGYCVEYDVVDMSRLYPVFYEKRKVNATKAVAILLTDAVGKVIQRKTGVDVKKTLFDNKFTPDEIKESFTFGNKIAYALLFLNNTVKYDAWAFQREVRGMYINKEGTTTGTLLPLSSAGLSISKVYAGHKMSNKKKAMLDAALKDAGLIASHRLVYKDNSEFFELTPDGENDSNPHRTEDTHR